MQSTSQKFKMLLNILLCDSSIQCMTQNYSSYWITWGLKLLDPSERYTSSQLFLSILFYEGENRCRWWDFARAVGQVDWQMQLKLSRLVPCPTHLSTRVREQWYCVPLTTPPPTWLTYTSLSLHSVLCLKNYHVFKETSIKRFSANTY